MFYLYGSYYIIIIYTSHAYFYCKINFYFRLARYKFYQESAVRETSSFRCTIFITTISVYRVLALDIDVASRSSIYYPRTSMFGAKGFSSCKTPHVKLQREISHACFERRIVPIYAHEINIVMYKA